MRKLMHRLAPWAFSTPYTYLADFDDVAEMVVVAHALRAQGYGARFDDTPLRLVVSLPQGGGR